MSRFGVEPNEDRLTVKKVKGEKVNELEWEHGTEEATRADVNAVSPKSSRLTGEIINNCVSHGGVWGQGERKRKRERERATSSVNAAAAPPESFSHFFHQRTPTLKNRGVIHSRYLDTRNLKINLANWR